MEEYRATITLIGNRHKNIPEIQFVVDEPHSFSIKPLSGGSANVVYLVTSQDGRKRFVFKHALSVLKNFGIKMSPRRIDMDCFGLMKVNELSPGCAPRVFCLDEETHSVCMEYMDNMESLTTDMNIRNHVDVQVAKKLGEIIGTLHKGTWLNSKPEEEAQKLKEMFIVEDLMKVKLEFGFVHALDMHHSMKYVEPEAVETFQKISMDESILKHKANLITMFCKKQQCVVHNDYYPGSVMVNDSDVKVYDMEFAQITVAGIDCGKMVSFYIMGYVRGIMEGAKPTAASYLEGVEAFLQTYMETISSVLSTREERKEMVEDISLFTGWYLLAITSFKDAHLHMRLSVEVKIVLWKMAKTFLDKAKDLNTVEDYMRLCVKSCEQEITA